MATFDLKRSRPASNPPQVLKIEAGFGRLYISGPAARRLLHLPGAAWNEKKNATELSLTMEMLRAIRKETKKSVKEFMGFCTDEVLAWARHAGKEEDRIRDMHQRIGQGYRMELPWYDRNGIRRPYDHQQVMATVACELDGCAFVCEMGTGKTRGAVEAVAHKLRTKQLDLVLVVCPKGVLNTWQREFNTWTNEIEPVVLRGSMKSRAEKLRQFGVAFLGKLEQVFITNYDVLYALEPTLHQMAKRGVRIGVVFDEMHKLRNPEARVSRSAMKLSVYSTVWRLGLTGSPILQGAQDIWSQWYVLDLGQTFGANHKQFKREFFTENKYDFSIDPLDGTLEEIGQRMRRIGLRYRKVDCLDLPPKVYETIDVEMTADQTRAYREMEEYLVARLRGDIPSEEEVADFLEEPITDQRLATATVQLVMMLRLTTITSGFVKDENDELYLFDPNPKLDALEEIVDENIGTQQIIVWARYRENIRAICERLARYRPAIIQGGQKDRERADAEEHFQSGRTRLLVANPAAGGVGLNLQAASLAIYYSQGYSLEHRIQSEDRCHRSGSEIHQKVTYIDLIASNTIDGVVAAALSGKKSVADMVVDLRQALGV